MTEQTVHFSRGIPPLAAIPGAELAEHTAAVLADYGPAVFQYPPIGRFLGDPLLREQLAKKHGVDPDGVFVTNGSLQALDLVAAHLLRGEDRLVYVERPTYDRAARILERHGAQVVSIPMEADGLDVGELRRRIRNQVPRFLYTIPDFQNPTGISLNADKRRELIAFAETYGLTIVEDIPYRELRFAGATMPGLWEMAGGARVITIGSLSKILSPGLRVGYVLTDEDTAAQLAGFAENVYLSTVPLTQAVAARALGTGLVQSTVERAIEILRPRHDAAVQAVRADLGEALMAVPGGGYYVGVELALDDDEDVFLKRARRDGLILTPGSAFHARDDHARRDKSFFRLPFQSLSVAEFRTGVRRLAALAR
jgi:2-aminoadipate transaminase